MKNRIFRAICLVAIAVLIAVITIVMWVLYDYFADIQRKQLQAETQFAARGVELEKESYLSSLSLTDTRITWVAPDGSVLYDNWFDPQKAENHKDREEIREAFENGYGESSRYSDSLMSRQIYAAQRLSDGSVLRLGTPQKNVFVLIIGMVQPTLTILVGAAFLALVVASGVSRSIVKPLNELDLDNPTAQGEYEELKPLIMRLAAQQRHLHKQESELARMKEEFNTATGGMNEGILLVGEKRKIISINPSAASILGISRNCVGLDTTVFDPAFDFESLLVEAEKTHQAERSLIRNNLSYRVMASAIVTEDRTVGFAIFLFDVTEKEAGEKMRREFTANVSHELKTPLHSISGCAELLVNRMVKSEDIPHFAKQIYDESARMIHLIDDIIKLSHLDEGGLVTDKTEVDLYVLSQASVDELKNRAEQNAISLSVEGESANLSGIPALLSAIVHNLVSNAIKYNKPHGYVRVEVTSDEKSVLLSVSDNGIGIPKEHHDRIFERFYRVDKSHSKEVGGTGLGLSIVKHAAKIHSAEITLDSEVDIGTTVTLRFPKE